MTAPPPSPAAPASTPPRPVPDLGGLPHDGVPGHATTAVDRRPAPPPGPGPARRRPPPAPDGATVSPRDPASLARLALVMTAVLSASWVAGRVTGAQGHSLVHNRMLPWILGRGLGVAGYVALAATVVLGIWLRHPWRARFRRPSATSVLWAHVTLAACSVTLVAGHVVSLALDSYAGVGWTGVLVPGGSHYRPTGVALGTLALYGLALVVGTAALAGSIGRSVWFPIHSAATLVLCIALVHGILSGSDGSSLRWVYASTGLFVLTLQFTRWLAGSLSRGQEVPEP